MALLNSIKFLGSELVDTVKVTLFESDPRSARLDCFRNQSLRLEHRSRAI
jgi:hypothetical protein